MLIFQDAVVNLFVMGVSTLMLTHFTLLKRPFSEEGDNKGELRSGVFNGLQTVFFIVFAILLTTPLLQVELPSWLGVPLALVTLFWRCSAHVCTAVGTKTSL
jgi:hypothetical protein